MKTWKQSIVIGFLAVIIICFVFLVCDNAGGVDLTGTYKRYRVSSATVNDRLIFTQTNVTFNKASSTIFSGTYKYDGATLTLTIGGVNHIKYATIDGTNVYITGDGAYSEYIKDRWVKQ